MFSVHAWSSRDDIRNLYCLLQDSPWMGKHNTWFLPKLPENNRTPAITWLLLSGLPNEKVGCFPHWWELKWVYAACLDLFSVKVCDFEVQVNEILAWKAGLQPWVIHQSFSEDCTKLILLPFGCFCIDALPNSTSEFFQCLHCPHVASTLTFCTSKCITGCLPQHRQCLYTVLAF